MPEYLYLLHHHERLKEEQLKQLADYSTQKHELQKEVEFKNVHVITASEISRPDHTLVAFGMKDGTTSVWNPLTRNLEFNTEKHANAVTCLRFFEKWKLISGSSNGEVFIHNVLTHKAEVKRTNTFEPKNPVSIVDISVNELGVAHALDSQCNLRVYDLWRNEKIAKMSACSSYAMVEGKGKQWLPLVGGQSLYSNRDFTAVVATSGEGSGWNNRETSVHVARNFEVILGLFEGLEATYKKGYERRKIENLFSNLEFAQLMDRNFEIPDFGHPASLRKHDSNNTKSLFSNTKHQQSDRSFKSSSKSKERRKEPSDGKKDKLTNEVLHP